jgi:hypothetical protein
LIRVVAFGFALLTAEVPAYIMSCGIASQDYVDVAKRNDDLRG